MAKSTDSDTELTTLVAELLALQAKMGELESQQAKLKEALATALSEAERRKAQRKVKGGTT